MIRLLAVAALLAGCAGQVAAEADADDLATADRDFLIPQGKHEAEGRGLGLGALHLGTHHARVLRFTATFGADVAYTTRDPANQADYGKLMGLTCDRIHHDSIRLGWAWNPAKQKVDLGYYGYIQGVRTMVYLTSVAPGVPVDVELRYANEGLSVTAGGVTHSEQHSLGLSRVVPSPSWVLTTAYFGGDETAPHDLHVTVRNVSVQ